MKRFPIMGGPSVPWEFVAPYEAQAKQNHDRTLERLAERGGLSPAELYALVHMKPWREVREISHASALVWLKNWLADHEGALADIKRHLRTVAKRDREIEVLTKERDDARAANAKLYKSWHQRNDEDTAHARQITSLRAQRDAALQRGFDIAREHAYVAYVNDDGGDRCVDWSAAEAELAKEKQK